jgi:NAD(P)-dependent dehydrogenase (short-subunit alcohol dehydrogenase family)
VSAVLITGAAGGIGRRAVARFAERGWTVFATDRSPADFGLPNVHFVELDVTSDGSTLAARETVTRLLDGASLDVIVNNAGIGPMGPIAEPHDDAARLMFEVNVLGPMRVTRAFLPLLPKGGGRVVTTGSLAGVVTLPFLGAYCASKHAAEAVSDAMRLELRPLGIRVSLVQPAIVDTAFVAHAVGSLDAFTGTAWQPSIDRTRALRGRFRFSELDPDQVARTLVRAAVARWPRARYPVGALAILLLRLLALMPTFVADALMRAVLTAAPRESPPARSVLS